MAAQTVGPYTRFKGAISSSALVILSTAIGGQSGGDRFAKNPEPPYSCFHTFFVGKHWQIRRSPSALRRKRRGTKRTRPFSDTATARERRRRERGKRGVLVIRPAAEAEEVEVVETARELFRLCLQGVASKQPRTVVPRFRVLHYSSNGEWRRP